LRASIGPTSRSFNALRFGFLETAKRSLKLFFTGCEQRSSLLDRSVVIGTTLPSSSCAALFNMI